MDSRKISETKKLSQDYLYHKAIVKGLETYIFLAKKWSLVKISTNLDLDSLYQSIKSIYLKNNLPIEILEFSDSEFEILETPIKKSSMEESN